MVGASDCCTHLRQNHGNSTHATPTTEPVTVSAARSQIRPERSTDPGARAAADSSVESNASGVTKTCPSMYCRTTVSSAANCSSATISTSSGSGGFRNMSPAVSASPTNVPITRCRPRLMRYRVECPASGTIAATIAQ